jgi:transcriptional regulator with XRE-family HTH domain
MSDIQYRIAKIIEELDLTHESFASKLGVSRNTITNILNEKQKPTLEQITKIVTIYNINADWLLTGNGESISNSMKKYNINESEPQIIEDPKIEMQNLKHELLLAKNQIIFLEKFIKETIEMVLDRLDIKKK